MDRYFDLIHLDIAFHRLQPELLLENIRAAADPEAAQPALQVSSTGWGKRTYVHYLMQQRQLRRTDDEAGYLAEHFAQRMGAGPGGVFALLGECARWFLKEEAGQLQCRQERLFDWRQLSLSLGQDLPAAAFCAGQEEWADFAWPAIVPTDHRELKEMLDRGVSENHFHLNGSTRLFALSWACMMNHPEQIRRFFQDGKVRDAFLERLDPGLAGVAGQQMLSWETRLAYGAWLRGMLYRRCRGELEPGELERAFLQDFDGAVRDKIVIAEDLAAQLRLLCQEAIPQRTEKPRVLDYAMEELLPGCREKHTRLLAGERYFLYRCLRADLTAGERDLFYLYLLIQNQFRSELIQVNGRIGFQNFSRYQNRKGLFWENHGEYWEESIRLAVNATLEDGRVRALEARVTPGDRARRQYGKIQKMDGAYEFAAGKERADAAASPLFYVMHFPKSQDEGPVVQNTPRNAGARKHTQKRARALAQALRENEKLRQRVRGIDACANEIGCRPEVFATEFRFLRSGLPCAQTLGGEPERVWLGATYHAGEDFAGLVDGLRAVDEAVAFLELARGDRIGHGLALGISPEDYYRQKRHRLLLPRQDLLDDLVWLRFRGEEYGLALPQKQKAQLEVQARRLMEALGYGGDLEDYFRAWALRGDHPDGYRENGKKNPWQGLGAGYEDFFCREDGQLKAWRENPKIRRLCWQYFFDGEIREKGRVLEAYGVDAEWIPLVKELQDAMQAQLRQRGIGIECNPSSNVLIGSFGDYGEHPIFRFREAGLSVSVNTDDQGVFDTSLENEYAFLARAMEEKGLEDWARQLDQIREMGNEQTFHPRKREIFPPAETAEVTG